MTDDPLELLRLVVEACASARVDYAVIGAVARNAWAPPRATADIDLAVAVVPATYRALIDALAHRGITLRRAMGGEAGALVPDLALLEGPPGPVRRVDLLIAKTAFEREAIERSVETDIGVACRVVRPEHLIVYKLIAARPRDLDDAAEVVRTRALAHQPVDEALVRRWAAEWGVEDRLEQLLAAARSA
jgi:hypothetical protein